MAKSKPIVKEEHCLWSLIEDDSDLWETSCGKAFVLTEGTPKKNKMRFCCFCGKKIESK